ncbi:hypothetical protein [Pandoraea sputorum]|uniref:hypothetical protein n=1 Tax=Pandoraea sputorum TaxID=93222 RepID=UPI00124193A3|nr:hypothetical protein [Pandoraea sputorum]VVE84324.1 hypothetical protein PSP31120_04580 [Pandoraea sputorum]
MANQFGNYMCAQVSVLTEGVSAPRERLIQGGRVGLAWAVLSFLAVCGIACFGEHLPSQYLNDAVSQGIGPTLWNVVGVLGMALFGFGVMFPEVRWVTNAAREVLVSTYGIGSLMFGLLAGLLLTSFPELAAKVEIGRALAMGLSGIILLSAAGVLNFAVWCLGALMVQSDGEGAFLWRAKRMHWPSRQILSWRFIATPPLFLLAEK